MFYHKIKLGLGLVIGMLVLGCSSYGTNGDDNSGPVEAKFSAIQSEIFNKSCALSGCHDSGSKQAGLNLSAGQAYSNLVNVPSSEKPNILRVKPNDAANSYLVMKIEGAAGISGSRMPIGGSLSSEKIDAIKTWINNGAKND